MCHTGYIFVINNSELLDKRNKSALKAQQGLI